MPPPGRRDKLEPGHMNYRPWRRRDTIDPLAAMQQTGKSWRRLAIPNITRSWLWQRVRGLTPATTRMWRAACARQR